MAVHPSTRVSISRTNFYQTTNSPQTTGPAQAIKASGPTNNVTKCKMTKATRQIRTSAILPPSSRRKTKLFNSSITISTCKMAISVALPSLYSDPSSRQFKSTPTCSSFTMSRGAPRSLEVSLAGQPGRRRTNNNNCSNSKCHNCPP